MNSYFSRLSSNLFFSKKQLYSFNASDALIHLVDLITTDGHKLQVKKGPRCVLKGWEPLPLMVNLVLLLSCCRLHLHHEVEVMRLTLIKPDQCVSDQILHSHLQQEDCLILQTHSDSFA